MSKPSVNPLLKVCFFWWIKFTSAAGHYVTVTRDRIGHVKVINVIRKTSCIQMIIILIRWLKCKLLKAWRFNMIILNKMRGKLSQSSSNFIKGIVGQWSSQYFRKCSEHHPVFSCITWSRQGSSSLLHATICVDESWLLFEITCNWKNQISIVDSLITSGSHVNNKGILGDVFMVKIISTQQENNLCVRVWLIAGNNSYI